MHLKEKGLVLLLMLLQKEALLAKSPKMRQLPVALQPIQLRTKPPPMLLIAATQHPKVAKLLKLKTTFIQLLKS